MSLTSWLRSRALALLLVGFLLATGGTVAAVGVGLVALATGTDLLVAAGVTIAVVAVCGTLAVVLLGAFAWTALARLVRTTGGALAAARRRLADATAAIEARSDRLASLGVSGLVSPGGYDPVLASLRRRYVAGELSEIGFERRLDELMASGRVDAEQARSVRAAAAFDRDFDRELGRDRGRGGERAGDGGADPGRRARGRRGVDERVADPDLGLD